MDIQKELGEWYPYLKDEFTKPYMEKVGRVIGYHKERLQPRLENVFRAFRCTAPQDIKIVIAGLDPYKDGSADGLAFSTQQGEVPYSLHQIFTELSIENCGIRTQNDLSDWADQGVLLLNTYLTTITGKTKAHEELGWHHFNAAVWRVIHELHQPIVYMLWGTDAQMAAHSISIPVMRERLSLKSAHPAHSAYNGYARVPFIGNNHFIRANKWLIRKHINPIEWITPLTGIPASLESLTSVK